MHRFQNIILCYIFSTATIITIIPREDRQYLKRITGLKEDIPGGGRGGYPVMGLSSDGTPQWSAGIRVGNM